jgi:hypothetical protein
MTARPAPESATRADARRGRTSLLRLHPSIRGWQRPQRPRARRKALAKNLGQPTFIALAYTIERKRKDYYAELEHNNKELRIDDWMTYFANTVLQAQDKHVALLGREGRARQNRGVAASAVLPEASSSRARDGERPSILDTRGKNGQNSERCESLLAGNRVLARKPAGAGPPRRPCQRK